MKQKRTVSLSALNPHPKYQNNHHRVYGYTVLDLADLFGVKETTIRQWIWRKKLDPKSLKSVIKLAVERGINLQNQDPEEDQ